MVRNDCDCSRHQSCHTHCTCACHDEAPGKYHWSDARQQWVYEEHGQEVGCIPGDVLPGSEHPRYYSANELAEMTIRFEG